MLRVHLNKTFNGCVHHLAIKRSEQMIKTHNNIEILTPTVHRVSSTLDSKRRPNKSVIIPYLDVQCASNKNIKSSHFDNWTQIYIVIVISKKFYLIFKHSSLFSVNISFLQCLLIRTQISLLKLNWTIIMWCLTLSVHFLLSGVSVWVSVWVSVLSVRTTDKIIICTYRKCCGLVFVVLIE